MDGSTRDDVLGVATATASSIYLVYVLTYVPTYCLDCAKGSSAGSRKTGGRARFNLRRLLTTTNEVLTRAANDTTYLGTSTVPRREPRLASSYPTSRLLPSRWIAPRRPPGHDSRCLSAGRERSIPDVGT